jgi:photosystem II stability/assembly factor-like uncharacterized protein
MSRNRNNCAVCSFLISTFLLMFAYPASSQSKPAARKSSSRLAQQPSASTPSESRFKGIFEPVSYQEDLTFNSVFFVTSEQGWVAGEKGTILHTSDAGKTWTVQLGGDPLGRDPDVKDLRFIDARHGWATEGNPLGGPLLRTADGQNWQQVGKIGDIYVPYEDYAFTSPSNGVYIQKETIRQTTDGGMTWRDVLSPCAARIQVQGITQQVGCGLKSVHFPTANVGYAVGTSGGSGTMILAKTTDGGATWRIATTPNAFSNQNETYFKQTVFFIDENTGFVRFSDGKVIMTSDGGQSWAPIGDSVVESMKFADPEVGWALTSDGNFSFTSDGGRHWSSRRLTFPAPIQGFSLPRRNRAYVVGAHGMIFRYSVVPESYRSDNMIEVPAMPAYNSPLAMESEQIKKEVATLREKIHTKLGVSAASNPGAGGFQQDQSAATNPAGAQGGFEQSTSATPGGFQQSTPDASSAGLVDSCCDDVMTQLSQSVNTFSADVPKFCGVSRSLNLIIAGLQYASDLTTRTQSLKMELQSLHQAHDPQATLSALDTFSNQVDNTAADTSAGFQQDAGFEQSTGIQAAPMQSSGFQDASQPAAQPVNQAPGQSPNSAGQTQGTLQTPAPKKKSTWKIPDISNVPIPHLLGR